MPKYFDEISAHPAENPREIKYILKSANLERLPEEYRLFQAELDITAGRIRKAFDPSHSDIRADLVLRLMHVARQGLGGDEPDIETAKVQFETVKSDVANAAYLLRSKRIHGMLHWSPAWLTAAFILFGAWFLISSNTAALRKSLSIPETEITTAAMFLAGLGMALIGVILGSLLMVFALNRNLTFENFSSVRLYQLGPFKYLLFVSLLTVVVAILLAFEVVQIGLGGSLLNDFTKMPSLGVLIGLMCSVSEPIIMTLVSDNLRPGSDENTE